MCNITGATSSATTATKPQFLIRGNGFRVTVKRNTVRNATGGSITPGVALLQNGEKGNGGPMNIEVRLAEIDAADTEAGHALEDLLMVDLLKMAIGELSGPIATQRDRQKAVRRFLSWYDPDKQRWYA